MTIESEYFSPSTDAASNVGNTAGTLLTKGREVAAESIAAAAWSLEGRADRLPGGKRVANFAHSTADALTCTADYIREHDANAMLEDATTIVKNNPLAALVGAAALGFLLAKAFSRD